MENTSYSQASSGAPKSTASKRRIWSKLEEEALILCLKEILEEGWRCENGFKTGYQKLLEKLLKKRFPTTDLSADHIKNKIHVWKKQNGSLQAMQRTSGFEWDDARKMMVFRDEDIWEEFMQTDPFAKGMKNKCFPYFKEWGDIFGKDRATGEFCEDTNAAEGDPLPEHNGPTETNTETDGVYGENDVSSPTNNISGSTSGKKKKGKKRNIDDTTGDKMVNLMGKFCEQTIESLQGISKRIGYEFSLSEKREKLFDALGKLGVLSADQQITVAKLLINNNKDLELFFTLPDDSRARMVTLMAAGRF